MAQCKDCFHADRNPETGERSLVEVPDMLAKTKPGKDPPMVRQVSSCGLAKGYFKTFGSFGTHNCATFEDASEKEGELREQLRDASEGFELVTSRKKLPVTTNSLSLIEIMAEEDDDAYSILLDAMSMGLLFMSRLITNLNDMNIRGPQIASAFEYTGRSMIDLGHVADLRSEWLVKWVNDHCDNDITGPAVQRYAAELGHKDKDDDNGSGKANPAPRKRLVLRTRINKKVAG